MITTTDVRVDYGDVTAVRDLNITIEAGEIFGLIGPNGAGKTSTIRVMATLLRPTYGDVHIAGFDIAEEPGQVRRILGYMPDNPPVYDDLKCWEFLDLFGGAYFVNRRTRRQRIDELLDSVSLEPKRHALAGTLSRGMKQRLVLAKTLLSDPDVLLLDEPASGLDPIARIEMRDVLRGLAERGKTVLISSHILTEMSDFCTSIGIMEEGRMIIHGRIDEIIDQLNPRRKYIVELIEHDDRAARMLEGREHVAEFTSVNGRLEIEFEGSEADSVALLREMILQDIPIKAFYEHRMDVEDILLKVDARTVS